MLKVISLWAGPGAGKSTTAAAVFARMKRLRFSVELVTEYAKDLTYEKNWSALGNQLNVLAQQNFRIARLAGQAEYVITDSPLPLSLIYCREPERQWLGPLIEQLWSEYDNIPFTLIRTKAAYMQHGRNETEQQARDLDTKIHHLAHRFGSRVAIDSDAVNIEDIIIREVNCHKREATTLVAGESRCPASSS